MCKLISILKITHCFPIPEHTLSTGWLLTRSRLRTSPSPGIGRRVDWYRYTMVSLERDADFKREVGSCRFPQNNAVCRPICRASYLRIPYSVYITAQSRILHPYNESVTKWL